MDQRDKAISDLSNLVNITVSAASGGTSIVSIGGVFAADGTTATKFAVGYKDGKLSLITADKNNTAAVSGGEVNAIIDIHNNKIPSYQDDIDAIVNQVVQSVNSLHSTGYDLLGNTGTNFFDSYQYGKLNINEDILNDPRKLAVSADGTTGNGDIATQLGNLADQKLIDGSTIAEKYSALISKIGNDKLTNDNATESNKLVLDQLTAQQSSYSGVSVDEEMTNILKFQRAYDASAKLIKIADDMLETLITMV